MIRIELTKIELIKTTQYQKSFCWLDIKRKWLTNSAVVKVLIWFEFLTWKLHFELILTFLFNGSVQNALVRT